MAGDERTGICGSSRGQRSLRRGACVADTRVPITSATTGGSLHDELAALGGAALDAALDLYLAGPVQESVQDEAAVTYAAKLGPADRDIDWRQPALAMNRQVRALNPSPAATTRFGQLDVKVLAGHVSAPVAGAVTGSVVGHDDGGIVVATAEGSYTITELQPAGKQRMSAQSFRNGYGSYL